MLRDAESGFNGAEIRGDGSSFVQFESAIGLIAVHDYWSYARLGFIQAKRGESYQEILKAQVPILSFGFTRPGSASSQLIVFLNGELDTSQGSVGSFLPIIKGKIIGELVSIENHVSGAGMVEVALYDNDFLQSMLHEVLARAAQAPSI
jgi:hypothetical protein